MGTSQIVQEFFQDFKKEDFDWNISKGPVELDKKLDEISKEGDFLFYKEADALIKLLKEFEEEKFNDAITKNIAVIGERGSGKTSFLKTIKNGLSKKEGYFVFDIVDPNILGSSINILEILISLIYGEVNKCVDFSDDRIIRKQTEIIKNLKDISITLSNLRKEEGYFKENNPPIEVLDDIHTRIKFNDKFKNLIENFKEFIEYKDDYKVKEVVLIIDDLDLIKNKEVYNMLNDIQNFLNGNIVLILGYRDSQLLNSVIDGKFKENDSLIKMGQLSEEEIKTQAINMIDKLIPYNNRIDLNIKNDIFTMNKLISEILIDYDKDSSRIKNLSNINVEDFFAEAILYKTNLPVMPIDDKEYTQYIFPQNLRGKLQLLELLVKEMKSMDELEGQANKQIKPYHMYHKNLPKFKKYFYSKLKNILPMEEVEIIKNWHDKPVEKKNYYMYKSIFNRLDSKNIANNQILNINYTETYNVCLGDIYEILELYKSTNCKSELDYYFIYSIKIIYSIELLHYLLNSFVFTSDEENRHKYLNLINVKVMPDNIVYNSDKDMKKIQYMSFLQPFFWKINYTDFPSNSIFLKKARPKELNVESNKRCFRKIYNYIDSSRELGSDHSESKKSERNILEFPMDPYSFLGKKNYLDQGIEVITSNNNKKSLAFNKEDICKSLIEYIIYINKDESLDRNDFFKDIILELKEISDDKTNFEDKQFSEVYENLKKYSYLIYNNIELEDSERNKLLTWFSEEIIKELEKQEEGSSIINNLFKSIKVKDYYLFYSILDIDIFARLLYGTKGNYRRALNKINNFLTSSLHTNSVPLELELSKKFVKKSFKFRDKNFKISNKNYPYRDLEKNLIQKIIEESEKEDKESEHLMDYIHKKLDMNIVKEDKLIVLEKELENLYLKKNIYIEQLNKNVNNIFKTNKSFHVVRNGLEDIYNELEKIEYNNKELSNNLQNIDLNAMHTFRYVLSIVLSEVDKPKTKYRHNIIRYLDSLIKNVEKDSRIRRPDEKSLIVLCIYLDIDKFELSFIM